MINSHLAHFSHPYGYTTYHQPFRGPTGYHFNNFRMRFTLNIMQSMMNSMNMMLNGWGGLVHANHQNRTDFGILPDDGRTAGDLENSTNGTTKSTGRGRDRTTKSRSTGSRQLSDGSFVDPLGRKGVPIKDADGSLLYVRTSSAEELRAYESESKKLLAQWDPQNLPGEPLTGPKSDIDYVGWAEEHFPGGFRQYQHNRSNSRTGVEDHEQLRKQLALGRGISENEVDYREVMWLYGQGRGPIDGARSKATASIWRRNPPGTPTNPSPELRNYTRQHWEALWELAPDTRPKDWVWPSDWKPVSSRS
jgi:hypothetical protein